MMLKQWQKAGLVGCPGRQLFLFLYNFLPSWASNHPPNETDLDDDEDGDVDEVDIDENHDFSMYFSPKPSYEHSRKKVGF